MSIDNYIGKNGDILVCKRKSFLSRIIRRITKGDWSHTALFAESWGQGGVIEAQNNGVNWKLWTTWQNKWKYDFIAFRKVGDVDTQSIMFKAFEKCGETKYDFWTFIRRAFGNRKKRSDKKENSKFICSEFTAYVHDIPHGYDMTPQEQYYFLNESPVWEIVFSYTHN